GQEEPRVVEERAELVVVEPGPPGMPANPEAIESALPLGTAAQCVLEGVDEHHPRRFEVEIAVGVHGRRARMGVRARITLWSPEIRKIPTEARAATPIPGATRGRRSTGG